jgi:NitT/TauT family transport system permease protein
MQGHTLTNSVRNSLRHTRQYLHFRKPALHQFAPLVTLAFILLVWQGVALLHLYPEFIIPPPAAVAAKFFQALSDGRLWLHTSTTLFAVVVGLILGVGIGSALGYLIAKSPLLEELLSPIIVAFQSTPIVAYAPLLIVWFGAGATSKVFTSALVVFFPMLMNTVVGIRNVPQNLRDLVRVSRATSWQTFTKLEVPAALPVLLTGLKTSATLAVIGAVIGEYISANAGLGFMINLARNQYDTPLVLVGVFTLALIARALYGIVALVERRVLAWQARSRR